MQLAKKMNTDKECTRSCAFLSVGEVSVVADLLFNCSLVLHTQMGFVTVEVKAPVDKCIHLIR